MEDRNAYLIRFLRGCAQGADNGQIGIDQMRLLVNGDLMREAADEFEKLLPAEESFKDTTDELRFNLVRAEQHARQAHDLLYLQDGPKRSVWVKMTLGRAQSILMSLYKQELARRE
jgi:hypothetical protein